MKLLILLSVCSCLANITRAQPKPCVSPPFLTGDGYMHTETITATGRFDYDALGQQLRLKTSGTNQNGTFTQDLLLLFQQKVAYEIDYSSKSCRKLALDVAFHPIQNPPGAVPVAQIVLGTASVAGMGLLANTWYGEIPEIQATYTTVFSENACLPLSGTFYSPQTGTVILSFYNILLGVRDPMDFFPPPFCRTESSLEEGNLPKTHFFKLIASSGQR